MCFNSGTDLAKELHPEKLTAVIIASKEYPAFLNVESKLSYGVIC